MLWQELKATNFKMAKNNEKKSQISGKTVQKKKIDILSSSSNLKVVVAEKKGELIEREKGTDNN